MAGVGGGGWRSTEVSLVVIVIVVVVVVVWFDRVMASVGCNLYLSVAARAVIRDRSVLWIHSACLLGLKATELRMFSPVDRIFIDGGITHHSHMLTFIVSL